MIEPKKIEKKKKGKKVEGQVVQLDGERHYTDRLYDILQKGYDLRYNIMTKKPEYKPKDGENFEYIDERGKRSLKVFTRRSGFKVNNKEAGIEDISDIVESSFFLPEVHPLREYLETLKWDKKNHIKALAACLKLDPDPELYIAGQSQAEMFPVILKRFLINSVAIMMNKPGAGNGHVMLILEGGQNKGKTTYLNYFMPPKLRDQYSYTGHIIPKMSDPTASNMLVERWWVHIDDQMHSFKTEEIEAVKALLTSDNVPDRKRYAISTKNELRTASFVASVNGRDIFTDNENRRYVVFCMDNNQEFAVDREALLKIDINQVWAQAFAALKANESYLYTTEERLFIKGKNLQFKKTSQEEEAILACFEKASPNDPDAKYHQATELMSIAIRALRMNFQLHHFTRALNSLGYESKSKKIQTGTEKSSRKVICVKYRYVTMGNEFVFETTNPNTEENDNNKNTAPY